MNIRIVRDIAHMASVKRLGILSRSRHVFEPYAVHDTVSICSEELHSESILVCTQLANTLSRVGEERGAEVVCRCSVEIGLERYCIWGVEEDLYSIKWVEVVVIPCPASRSVCHIRKPGNLHD